MFKLVACLIVLVLSLFVSGCTPATWTQYQGDGPSDGFAFVSTADPLQPKWRLKLMGPVREFVVYSSPVIGGMTADGSKAIYIGLINDELIAVKPNGTIKWRTTLPSGNHMTTPAVGGDGNIYVMDSRVFGNIDRNVVYSISPTDGHIRWGSLLQNSSVTLTSVKTWGFAQNLSIFASDQQTLHVFDQAGNLIATAPLCRDVVNDSDDIPAIIATPAVADTRRLSNPIVVASSWHCLLQAFQWNVKERKLEPLWATRDDSLLSSPAVMVPAALVVVGTETGLSAYDLYTGEKQWSYEASAPPVFTPPAFLLGINIYFRDNRFLYELNSNGELLYRTQYAEEPDTSNASPVVTANHVYLNTSRGLQSYSLDLSTSRISLDGGRISPAVDNDGTIYNYSYSQQFEQLDAYSGP